jgi:hypothetical protein
VAVSGLTITGPVQVLPPSCVLKTSTWPNPAKGTSQISSMLISAT